MSGHLAVLFKKLLNNENLSNCPPVGVCLESEMKFTQLHFFLLYSVLNLSLSKNTGESLIQEVSVWSPVKGRMRG